MRHTFDEALNSPEISAEWTEAIIVGCDKVCESISNLIIQAVKSQKKPYCLAFDGFLGVKWERIIPQITNLLKEHNLNLKTIDITSCYKPPDEIEKMVRPCLTIDPHFGSVFRGRLKDFFDSARLEALKREIKSYKKKRPPKSLPDVVICYGTGAAIPRLRSLYDAVFYVDITRESLFKRIKDKQVLPIGSKANSLSTHLFTKRLYYVDYQVLKSHKKYLLKHMDWYIDGNVVEDLKLLSRDIYDGILSILAQYPFRLNPIYIAGVWGGQEMKRIRKLPESMPNCAFALEVIPQKQSLKIVVGNAILEMPFYNLLWNQPMKILGSEAAKRFRGNFPITLNYDDTCQGGHLAIQVHPNGVYLRKNFNEQMRRDETYYAVKTYPGAKTYHGLKEETDLKELFQLCLQAERENIPFNQDLHINSWPSKVGDLFLIPAGTIHASGGNQLVLEIDTDPSKNAAEYTFHLYDYLRPDLDGTLRAIHIEHSFRQIKPHRRTKWVAQHLKQPPRLIRNDKDGAEYLLGEFRGMYYEVHRLEFTRKINDDTKGKFHILTLVEGEKVIVKSQEYPERQYELHYTETVIIPACLGRYSVINLGKSFCKLTKALLK